MYAIYFEIVNDNEVKQKLDTHLRYHGFEFAGNNFYREIHEEGNMVKIYRLIEDIRKDKETNKGIIVFKVFRVEDTSDFTDIIKED